MKLGYRRYSGTAFIDTKGLKSRRGAYLEKRLAFLAFLKERGHSVEIIKNGDDFSGYDKIFVEFGSTNRMFHQKDIEFSEEILKSGKAIFILDDPDMMPKDLFGAKIWVNAADPRACSVRWKKSVESFPISGLQKIQYPKRNHNGKIVYYGGTSGGREKKLLKYKALMPNLEIYGHPKDYKSMLPKEPPTEDKRTDFYSNFMACLNVRDNLHRKVSWYTGRKYDALIAGCPVIEEEAGMFEIAERMKDPNIRRRIFEEQKNELLKQKEECVNIFKKYKL